MRDPIVQFKEWYLEAQGASNVDVDAMAVATSSKDGRPTCRIVYYRQLIGASFCFFTNYSSSKGHDLTENPKASAVFLWHMIDKQVRIEGPVLKLGTKESDDYFNKRPVESQLSAATSKQSQELESYQKFLDEIELKRKSTGAKVTRPDNWGGYAIQASKIEFWQSRPHRRHLREAFIRDEESWKMTLLYP